VLIELGVMQQRHEAVLEVLGGTCVTEVARRYGVARQTVHRWLRRYAASGIAGLADDSSRPATCPHQMAAEVEARIVELRRAHPGWGPRTIAHYLGREQAGPLPSRSSIYRCLVRHQLIEPQRRRKRREDYRRWERLRPMELWQMDVMGGVKLEGGGELKLVSGLDDHSRYCVSAKLVERATARPVCAALTEAMQRCGVPEQVLTDNGKVFTARFGPGTGEVLFDRILRENGVRHLLTAPRSPTTTGKVERFHKTVRSEFLRGRTFASLTQAQAELDEWVVTYNQDRPHQGIGMVPPAKRFALAAPGAVLPLVLAPDGGPAYAAAAAPQRREVTRLVGRSGKISLCGFPYYAGSYLAGETVSVAVTDSGLVEISHRGELIAARARRHPPTADPVRELRSRARPRPQTAGMPVTRLVDPTGFVSFAGSAYFVGSRRRGEQVEVRLVAGSVQISQAGELIKMHGAKHDPSKEHGAFATPGGRPRRRNAADDSRTQGVTHVLEPMRNAGGET